MRTRREFLVLILVSILAPLIAQTNKQPKRDSLIERARTGDTSAIVEMETQGNVHDLKALLHDPIYAKGGTLPVQIALARLGDRESLQFFACRSLTDDLDKMKLLLRDEYDHIGGAFTARIYRQLLDSDPRFLAFVKKHKKDRYSDVLVTLPSSMVLPYLSKLLPNANIPSPPCPPLGDCSGREDLKDLWRKWIDDHNDEIERMNPTGRGITFSSSSCRNSMRKPDPTN